MLKPYPDEILVGLIARYHAYSGHMSFRDSIRELYGMEGVRPSLHLPSHINRLVANGSFGRTAEELVFEHTLFPYYQPFLKPSVAQRVLNDMIQDRSLGVHFESGLVSSRVTLSSKMVCCPVCIEEDIRIYGEPYWHRVHHIPGVKVCPTHRVKLYDACPTCGSTLNPKSIQEFPYFMTVCSNGHSLLKPEHDSCQLLERFALDSEFVLQTSATWKSTEDLRERYVNSLYAMGMATQSGSVRQSELFERFFRRFPLSFWEGIGVEGPVRDKEWNWLRELVRKPKKALHPIFHIALMEFLCGSVQRFYRWQPFVPFGNAPWPCLNRASDHYMQNVVEDLTVTSCTDTGRPVGTFRCECGFVYSRRGPDRTAEDRTRYGRIKEFGYVWERKLSALVSDGNLSLRGMARELGTDPKVITLKKNQTQGVVSLNSSTFPFELNSRRDSFAAVVQQNPDYSRSQLKRISYGDYQWLYCHDRDWLESILPPRKVAASIATKRVDWAKRDFEMSILVEHAAQTIRNLPGKPMRVTLGQIGRICGNKSLLEKRLNKLPVTAESLKSCVESLSEFQKRRINWVVDEMTARGELLTEWKIIRLAGLKPSIQQEVHMHLVERIRCIGAITPMRNQDQSRQGGSK